MGFVLKAWKCPNTSRLSMSTPSRPRSLRIARTHRTLDTLFLELLHDAGLRLITVAMSENGPDDIDELRDVVLLFRVQESDALTMGYCRHHTQRVELRVHCPSQLWM